ncbi:ATP-binding cassette domain-containing protein [Actinomadura rudentiformis]|uniref:ATP-binding cassette domain-containing protein n=1 Tax=Actinomadura rudentiformis TaxID=359158 RepID=UPI0021F44540|nr:ATP-binding cassette domain-containing protein [Actinomadura rudentiformis]
MAFGVSEGVTGLAGPPGVGKSTLLATFATLRRPHVGVLKILGYDTGNNSDLRTVRARIGYLPGNFTSADNLTVGEFVAYAAYYKRVRSDATRSILKRLDLLESESTEMSLVPPDVRLRAGLAATCVHEPELVLLDDPLHGVGDVEASELLPLIGALAPTILVSAPTPQALTGWCDRVFTLARGRLTERATRSAPADGSTFGFATPGPHRERAALSGERAGGEVLREDREAMSRSPLSWFGAEPPGEGPRPRRPKKLASV